MDLRRASFSKRLFFVFGTRISLTFETEVENGFGLWEPVEFTLP